MGNSETLILGKGGEGATGGRCLRAVVPVSTCEPQWVPLTPVLLETPSLHSLETPSLATSKESARVNAELHASSSLTFRWGGLLPPHSCHGSDNHVGA